jgi:hypothetical protein
MALRILADSFNRINSRRIRNKKDRTHRRDRLAVAIRPVVEILETRCLLSASVVYVNSAWAGSSAGSDPGALGTGNSFGYDEFADIQDGVNAVAAGGTVEIDNGSYTQSNIVVSQAMTIQGQSQSGVVLSPAKTDSHDDSAFGGSASNGFVIAASGVTIEDLTIDGGANQNFRAGVITNSPNDGNTYSDTTIQDVTINNTFRQGVALYNFTGTSTGNVVENDTFNNVGSIINDSGNAYQATAAIGLFQSSGDVENNAITNSAAGIVGGTFDGSSQNLTVTSNSFTSASTVLTNGALGIDLADLAGGSTVSGNTIDLTGSGTAGNDNAIVVGFDKGSVAINTNSITGQDNDNGIVLFQDSSNVTLDGNSITFGDGGFDNGTGILLTDQSSDTSLFGAAPGAVSATLTNDTISGFNFGVWLNSSGDAVNATIGDPNNSANANSFYGDYTGVEVDGGGANATITNNFSTVASDFYGCLVGVGVDGGTASIQDNMFIYSDTAIQVVAGTANVDANNFISSETGIEADNGTMTADNNLFFDTEGDEIYVSNSANTPVVTAYDNAFYVIPNFSGTGNFLAVDNQNPNVTVDARLNFWGSNQMTATAIEAETTGSVAFAPWIDSAPPAVDQSMTSPGFYGDFSALDVSSEGAQIGSLSPIQQAINDLTPGGTITLDDGAYAANLDITKALTIQSVDGAGSTTISDPTSPTGAITIESGVSGATITGLTIIASNSPWALNILGTDATVTDNVFESTGSGNVQTADASNTITGNTFIAPSAGSETGFEQYNDTASGDDSSGEITGLLASNTFNRAFTAETSGGAYVRTIWADVPSILTQVSGASSVNEGATYTLNLNPAIPNSSSVTGWTINWGDGASGDPDIQTVSGDPTSVTHVYAQGNNNGSIAYTISASVQSNGSTAPANNVPVTVDDAPLSAIGTNISAIEGMSTGSVTVATLTDSAGTYSNPASLAATINWGDSSSSAATLVATNTPGVFNIQGTHTYNRFGSYTINVSVTDSGGSTALAHSTASVGDASLVANGVNVSATEGTALSNVIVATLADAAGSSNLGDLSATINWGDSSSSSAAIVQSSTPGVFDIEGSHVYSEYGSYTIKVNVNDVGGSTAAAQSTATVADATLSASGVNVNATEGAPLSNVTVATLTDSAGTYTNLSNLSATINWGDSFSSAATLVGTGTPGVYSIEGSHTYAEYGNYTVSASVTDTGGNTASANSTATVADAALSATGVNISATEGAPLSNVTVATLTDSAGTYTNLSNLSATINWGDSSSSAATLVGTGTPGIYSIEGSHTYAEYGNYTVGVSVTDTGGSTASAHSTATVVDAALSATGVNITATQGQAISNAVVATLTDAAGTYSNLHNLSATINWGDSSSSAATLVATSTAGVYSVEGSHTYSGYGSFTINVSVTDTGGSTAAAHSTATVTAAATTATVAHEYLFYYGSTAFDGGDLSPSSADYKAIATNKSPLLQGQTATFSNVSSYTGGINGILVDFSNLSPSVHLTAADFQFKVGNSNNISTWATAPAPSKVVTWVGPNGDTFADITWANHAIQNEWLQVTVLADANTHLASNTVFYFGNLVAATGYSVANSALYVTPIDVLATLLNLSSSSVGITNLYDFNRDGKVNATDLATVILDESFSGLQLITTPS